MFVDIENFKSPLAIENLLIPYKRGRLAPDKKSYLSKEPISPDVCWEVLRSTNAPRSIKDMLSCIADLPPSQQAQFKDVVLSTFTQREQPNDILVLAKKLAQASGYEEELAEAQKLTDEKLILSATRLAYVLATQRSYFSNDDFTNYEKLICLSHLRIDFCNDFKFPKNIEFPNSDEVNCSGCDLINVHSIRFNDKVRVDFSYAQNLPSNLDVSQCLVLNLSNCDLKNLKNLCFRNNAIVYLRKVRNLPSNLDVYKCSEIDLSECDLKDFSNIHIRDGAGVYLAKAQNLPSNLDVSRGAVVDLSECDLKKLTHLRFRNNAVVYMRKTRNLPSYLDFSHCDKVILSECDLSGLQELCFKKGATVSLENVVALPSKIDVSGCEKLNMLGCCLDGVECLSFKNRQQMIDCKVNIPDDWKGKVIYTDTTLSKFRALFNRGR